MSKKKEIPIGNQIVQYQANGNHMEQIYQARDILLAIYINVSERREDKKYFDNMEECLDRLHDDLVKENSNIAAKYFKSQKS